MPAEKVGGVHISVTVSFFPLSVTVEFLDRASVIVVSITASVAIADHEVQGIDREKKGACNANSYHQMLTILEDSNRNDGQDFLFVGEGVGRRIFE